MTQVVFTETEAERLKEIKRTHDNRILRTPNSPTSTLPGAAEVRHNHRGELLTMLDAVAARTRKAIDDCEAAVIDANKAHERADARSRIIAELQADMHRLRNENRDLVQVFENLRGANAELRRDLDGTVAELNRMRRENEALKAPRSITYPAPGAVYIFDMEEPGAETVTEKPSFHIKRSDAHKYTVEMKEGPSKNVGALLLEMATIAVIANHTKA